MRTAGSSQLVGYRDRAIVAPGAVPFLIAIVLSTAPGSYFDLPSSPMRTCPQGQRMYRNDTDFCPRADPLHSAVTPTWRLAHAGLKPGAISVAPVSDQRPAIGDRRYKRGICRCDEDRCASRCGPFAPSPVGPPLGAGGMGTVLCRAERRSARASAARP